jgi:hypothetical protein
MNRTASFFSCGECDVGRLGSNSIHSAFFNLFWIASMLVCSFCETMPESLPVASTAVSSAKVAVVECAKVGRFAFYSNYSNGPRLLPWGTLAMTGESSVCSISTFTRLNKTTELLLNKTSSTPI